MGRPEDGHRIVSAHYRGDAGERYVRERQADPDLVGYDVDLRYFLPHLLPVDVVLDFGCGNGGMLRLIAPLVRTAEGLEVNPHAARLADRFGHRIYAGLAELPDVPYFDVVLSNHVLEHVRDVPGTLERLRRSMKRGARLLLKLPIDDWRAREQREWAREDVDHHLQTWTPRLIGNVLREAGYGVEHVRIVTSAWHPRLFPLLPLGLGGFAFWALAVVKNRRQLFVRGRVPV